MSALVVVPTDLKQCPPVLQNDSIRLPQAHSAIVYVVGLCPAAVELQNGEITSRTEIINRSDL
jgi:hypothetical protein